MYTYVYGNDIIKLWAPTRPVYIPRMVKDGLHAEQSLVSIPPTTSVCRQMHAETKLLAFKNNAFLFQPRKTVDILFSRLLRWQQDAIAHVHLCHYLCGRVFNIGMFTETGRLRDVKCLKIVTVGMYHTKTILV